MTRRRLLLDACEAPSPSAPAIDEPDFRFDRRLFVHHVRSALKLGESDEPQHLLETLVAYLCEEEPLWDMEDQRDCFSEFGGAIAAMAAALVQTAHEEPIASSEDQLRVGEEELAFYTGDLHVSGDAHVEGTLVVLGDLNIAGALISGGDSWWSGTIVVLGAAQAERMCSLGPVVVGKTLAVREGVYAEYYHDAPTSLVAARIETPVLVQLSEHDAVRAERCAIGQRHTWLESEQVPARPGYFEDGARCFSIGDFADLDGSFFGEAA